MREYDLFVHWPTKMDGNKIVEHSQRHILPGRLSGGQIIRAQYTRCGIPVSEVRWYGADSEQEVCHDCWRQA
jgi:hypothetical protein